MRFVLPLIAGMLLTAGPSAAFTFDAGPAAASAEMSRNPGCTLGADEELCAGVLETHQSASPKDWDFWFNKSIREISVEVKDSPHGAPIHKSFRPDHVFLEHPLFTAANETWKASDETLPPDVREYVQLKSAGLPDETPNNEKDESTWGLQVVAFPPGQEPRSFWVLCWDIACQRVLWGYFDSNETGIYFAPSVNNADGWESHEWLDTTLNGHHGVLGCESSLYEETGCPEAALGPARERSIPAVSFVNNETPELHTFYEINETSVHVGPPDPLPKRDPPGNGPPASAGPPPGVGAHPDPRPDPPKSGPPPPSPPGAPPGPPHHKQEKGPDVHVSNGLVTTSAIRKLPTMIATVAIATGAAVIIGLVLLLTRLQRDRVLEHPMRRAVYDAICKEPGIRVGTLATRFGVHYGTIQHHVDALTGFSLVRMQGRQLLPVGLLSSAEEERCTGCLASPTARRVYELLLARGPQDLTQIASELGLSYTTASATTVQLRKAGLVARRREWRRQVLEVVLPTAAAQPRGRDTEFVWNPDARPTAAKPTNPT